MPILPSTRANVPQGLEVAPQKWMTSMPQHQRTELQHWFDWLLESRWFTRCSTESMIHVIFTNRLESNLYQSESYLSQYPDCDQLHSLQIIGAAQTIALQYKLQFDGSFASVFAPSSYSYLNRKKIVVPSARSSRWYKFVQTRCDAKTANIAPMHPKDCRKVYHPPEELSRGSSSSQPPRSARLHLSFLSSEINKVCPRRRWENDPSTVLNVRDMHCKHSPNILQRIFHKSTALILLY